MAAPLQPEMGARLDPCFGRGKALLAAVQQFQSREKLAGPVAQQIN
jgi:hypothetical protein